MSAPTLLDHVVIAGPDLPQLVAWFAERTGVTAAPGGVHPTGTANALVAFTIDGERGTHYLELIGPDPARDVVPTTFGIDALSAPRIVTYAVHPGDIDGVAATATANGLDIGSPRGLSRVAPDGTNLAWRLTPHAGDEAVPFLIDWGETQHPGLGDLPAIGLVSFERVDPSPAALDDRLAALGLPSGALAATVHGETPGYRLRLVADDGREVALGA